MPDPDNTPISDHGDEPGPATAPPDDPKPDNADTPAPTPAPAPASDPFAAAADQVAGAHKAVLRASLRSAADTDPDAYAHAAAVARDTGMRADVALRNPRAAAGVAKAQQADGLAAQHPELAQWLSRSPNAQVAHDDIDVLQVLDHTIQAIQGRGEGAIGVDPTGILPPGFIFDRNGTIIEPLKGGLANVIGGVDDLAKEMGRRGNNAFLDDLNRQAAAERYGNPLGLGWFGRKAEFFLGGLQRGRGTMGGDTESSLDAMAAAYPEEAGSLPTRLTEFGGAMASQFPELLLGGEFGGIAKALYTTSRAQRFLSAAAGARAAAWAGKGVETAAVMAPMNLEGAVQFGKEQGALAGVTDFLASSAIVGATGPVGVARSLVTPLERATVARGWAPALAGIMRDAGLMGTQNAALVLAQTLERRFLGDGKQIDPDELMHQMAQAGELGVTAGSIFAIGPEVAAKAQREATAAIGGMEFADKLKMGVQQLQESKLQKRSPEAMRSALDAMLGEGAGDRHVYLQSKDWQDHWNTQGVDPVAQAKKAGVLERFIEAQAHGGQMQVPVGAYLQAMADSKTPEGLIGKTRAAPAAMSAEEGAQWHQAMPEAVARYTQQAAAMDAARGNEAAGNPAVQAIYDDVKAQISAARPHWPEATLDAVAQVYSRTLAGIARFGTPEGAEPIDPMSLHQKVSIGSELPESLRTKGFDAIKTLMDKIRSGEGAIDPASEQAMADLAKHADVVGGALDEHTLANVGELMRTEAERAASPGWDHKPGATELVPHQDSERTTNLRAEIATLSDTGVREQAIDQALAKVTGGHVEVTARHENGYPKEFQVFGDDGVRRPGELSKDQVMELRAEIASADAARKGRLADASAELKSSAAKDSEDTKAARIAAMQARRERGGFHTLDQSMLNAPGESLAFQDLKAQWMKAHGEREPAKGSHEWDQLVQEARRVDEANGKTYEQSAYHGTGNASPYAGGKLSYDKVGGEGGEGTQIEGHGVYVTSSKGAGTFYREQNAAMLPGGVKHTDLLRAYFKPGTVVKSYGGYDKVLSFDVSADGNSWSVKVVGSDKDGTVPDSRNGLPNRPRSHSTAPSQLFLEEALKQKDPALLAASKEKRGRLYSVDIPDDTGSSYLDWDRPISEQSETVQDTIDTLIRKNAPEVIIGRMEVLQHSPGHWTGERAYRLLAEGMGSPKAASDALQEAGIVGNKYLGNEGEGPYHNYVVFQDVPFVRYEQQARGGYTPGPDGTASITLGPGADPSTVLHELGHYALDTLADFAGRAGAPEKLRTDMQTLMEHIGVKDLEAWKGMDFEARRAHHERFAESFESYFMEGKAPSPELRGVFRKIRSLMVAVYRTLKNLISLTPAVREVFDRLLASDDEIARAREEMGAKPAFSSAEQAGMAPEEFAAYLRDFTAETENDRSRLQDKTMADVERRLTDNWRVEETNVRGNMETLVNQRPEFKAMLALHSGEWPEGTKPEGETGPLKLDRADLVKLYGEDALKQLPGRAGFSDSPNRGAPLYAHEGGIPLDSAAAVLGFRSGDELFKALTEASNRTMAIDKMTAAEMRRRHPDANLEEAAQDVLHGAASGKRILRELDSLGKAVGEAPPPIEVLRAASERTIAGRDVRSINPEVYRRAEAKAARDVLEKVAAGDKRGAYEAQVRRVLSAEMFKAANDAKQTVLGAVDYARKFSDKRVREILGKAGGWEWTVTGPDGKPLAKPDGTPAMFPSVEEAKKFSDANGAAPYERTSSYLGQIDALRERFGFVKIPAPGFRETLTAWIKDEAVRGSEVVIPDWIAESTDRMLWKDLSFEKFYDVFNAMQNIEHLGRARNKVGDEMGKVLLSAKVGDLTEVSNANKQRIRKRSTAPGLADKVADLAASWDAMLTRLSTQIHIMDGFKDGGQWWETFVRPLQEAANREAGMQAADARAMHDLAKAAGYLDQSGRLWKREYVKEIDDHLSHINRLLIAAYWGRQEGRERLLTAHWSEDQIQRLVLDKLDAKDRDFLHGVWLMFDKKFPDLRAMEQRLSGVTVEKSQSSPFTNRAGLVFKGGYIPIKYDPRANPKAESLVEATNLNEQKRGMFGRAKTRDSMVKATAQTTGMKLRLDEGVLFDGLRETNHRLSHQDVLTDLSKILTHKGMADTITKNHGIDAYNLIRDTLTDVAVGQKESLGAFGTVIRHLRTGVPSAAFGFNFMRAGLDIAESLPQAVVRVGPTYLLTACGKMFASAVRFESFAKSIAEKSPVMADRQRTSLRMANDAFKGARRAGKIREQFDHLAQAVMHRAHLFTDHLVWQAAYDAKLVEFNGDEAKAVAVADSITQDTQSSGRQMDLSKFQRGGELNKLLTVAYGFFGSVYQLQKTAAIRGLRNPTPGSVGRMFADYLCLYSLPIAIDMAIKGAIRGDVEDKSGKELGWEFAKEHLAFALGSMPGARELSGALTGPYGYSGPAGERGVTALYAVVQNVVRAIDHAVSDKPEHQAPERAGMTKGQRDALQFAGVLFHLPATQIQRSIDGTAYALEHNQNPLLPFFTGKPPKKK